MKRNLLLLLVIAASSLLAAQWISMPQSPAQNPRQQNEKINLALRQVGHQLLSLAGNDTSAVPPVNQIAQNEFSLELNDAFNYDTLPYLLSCAFEDFGIMEEYHIAVKDCDTNLILLGYTSEAFESGVAACMGRERSANCYNTCITFPNKIQQSDSRYWMVGIMVLVFSFIVAFYLGSKNKKQKEEEVIPINENTIQIGNTVFDYNNQTIEIDGQEKNLTFRENKLLHYFAQHTNQVLERETILSAVWEDEGVVVSRSLDVFISRLRKILKEDATLNIKNIHGVGYRLEVKDVRS